MNRESLDMKKKLDVCDENFKNKYFPNALILRNLIEENIKRWMEKTLDECLADFTKLFILYIFNTILFPTSNHATPKILLHYVNNLEKLNSYDWDTAVYEFLVKSISKCVEEKKSYVNGCVMILEPWLQEHIIYQLMLTTKMVYPRLLKWVEGSYQHADTHKKYIDNLIYTQVIEEIKPTYEERNLLTPPVISKYTELMAIRENSGGHNLLKCYFFNAWFHVSRLKIHLLKNCEIECDGFTVSIDQECPQQPNSFDCGVYLMKFMECLSRGDIFDFNSGPMNFEQKKLVAQLMLGKMITPQ
ncbi:uncharacterized protein LOC131218911 isoform X1 [Magnolia sinica]|uniref:uncharacterized protein LOC131218911 isoform X1 n=1 Tax=Magnolia sinica TaxID=86752 RepID=UPI002657C4E5|nr:uncharacterized protein LOC131218911 isoform X1 [Magnolia sinica]